MPLVGVALMAVRAQPDGFPRYHNKEASFSALVNKALDARNLRPAGAHQRLYSLRHSFSDRLANANCDSKIIDQMMGHVREGMKYGVGAELETKHEWLKRIALKPPSTV